MTKPLDELMRSPQRPRAIQQVADAVAKLTMPPLVPLCRTILDMQTSVQEQRMQLRRELDEVRMEGFEAASRLALSVTEVSPQLRRYFDQQPEKE